LEHWFIEVEVGEMLVVVGFEVSTLVEDYSIVGFAFEVEMEMIEEEIGMVEDGFGTAIDFSLDLTRLIGRIPIGLSMHLCIISNKILRMGMKWLSYSLPPLIDET
jgi:hypothetical protein